MLDGEPDELGERFRPHGLRGKVITPNEAFAIFDEIQDELVRCLIVLIRATGIRFSEAPGLKWSDVRWEKKDIMIRRRYADGEMEEPKSIASNARWR